MPSALRILRWGIVLSIVVATITTVSTPVPASLYVSGTTTDEINGSTVTIEIGYNYNVAANTTLDVFIDINNTGKKAVDLPLTLYLNDTAVNTTTVRIPANNTKEITLSGKVGWGNTSVRINQYNFTTDEFNQEALGSTNPDIRATSFDSNRNGLLDLAEIQRAINYWANDRFFFIQDLINKWAEEKTIS